MKIKMLMDSSNHNKDNDIIEYAEKPKLTKGKSVHLLRTLGMAMMCLVVVLICVIVLSRTSLLSGAEDPKAGAQYEFRSYDELCEILPDGSIMANIPNSLNAKIEICGICPEGTMDFADINNYSYLYMYVSYSNNTGVGISCTLNFKKTLQEYVDSRPLSYVAENTEKITIGDSEVYYTFYFSKPYGGEKIKVNEATFAVDGNLYKVRSDTLSKGNLIQYVEELLAK